MKIQLALDDISLTEALALVDNIYEYIDIIEIGTPFIIKEGVKCIKSFRERFPDKEILADLKIMDAGYYEAESAFKIGANYITVLGVTDLITIKECKEVAKKYDANVVVDMICVSDLPKKIKELEELDVDYIAVHVGVDQQALGRRPIDDLKVMKQYVTKTKIAVAGGINAETIDEYLKLSPDIIIIGSGIVHASDPIEAIQKIRKSILSFANK